MLIILLSVLYSHIYLSYSKASTFGILENSFSQVEVSVLPNFIEMLYIASSLGIPALSVNINLRAYYLTRNLLAAGH